MNHNEYLAARWAFDFAEIASAHIDRTNYTIFCNRCLPFNLLFRYLRVTLVQFECNKKREKRCIGERGVGPIII